MKKIAIITYSKKAGRLQYNIFRKLFQNKIFIIKYSIVVWI